MELGNTRELGGWKSMEIDGNRWKLGVQEVMGRCVSNIAVMHDDLNSCPVAGNAGFAVRSLRCISGSDI